MQFTKKYISPIGRMLIACDDEGLTGLWFYGQKYFALGIDYETEEFDAQPIKDAVRWLDVYFSGKEPDFTPPLHMIGSPFQMIVWSLLLEIPYGQTMTYGQLSKLTAEKKGVESMSSQAVGGAVGHNKISIIVPCHRVLGSYGNLTGYAGGLDRTISLLEIEGEKTKNLIRPKKGTAL